METANRYSQNRNCLNNAYVACASTGKAAVNLGGTTVHSAFHITQSRRVSSVARETLQQYRQLFANVRYVFIDEVSMIGSDVLHKVNQRLQEITGSLDETFGRMDMIYENLFCPFCRREILTATPCRYLSDLLDKINKGNKDYEHLASL